MHRIFRWTRKSKYTNILNTEHKFATLWIINSDIIFFLILCSLFYFEKKYSDKLLYRIQLIPIVRYPADTGYQTDIRYISTSLMQCPYSIWLSFCASDYITRAKVIQKALHRLNSSFNRWKYHCPRRIIDLKSVLSFKYRPLNPQHGQVLCFYMYLNQVLNFLNLRATKGVVPTLPKGFFDVTLSTPGIKIWRFK